MISNTINQSIKLLVVVIYYYGPPFSEANFSKPNRTKYAVFVTSNHN